MKEYVMYRISCLDIQEKKRFTFNTSLYNCYSLKSTLSFAKNMQKNCSEFYSDFRLEQVKCEVILESNL